MQLKELIDGRREQLSKEQKVLKSRVEWLESELKFAGVGFSKLGSSCFIITDTDGNAVTIIVYLDLFKVGKWLGGSKEECLEMIASCVVS